MAGKTANTALQTAIQGGKVSDKAAQSALSQAVGRITSLTKRANTSKEAMMETGTLVLHTAETQGSLFLASLAEGYLGEDRMKLGSVDLRAPVGLLAQGYGLYQTMSGQRGAGAHVLSLGNGVMGSWLASVARNAGRTLAERRGDVAGQLGQVPSGAPAPAIRLQGAPMLPAPSLFPEPGLAGATREVLLTPEATEGDELGRRGLRRRMRQRERLQEPDDELLEGEDDLAGDEELGRRGGRGRGRGRRMRQRMRQRMQRRQTEPDDEEEALEGDDIGRRGRPARGRFVRALDDDND
jgi:hypothetical protein